MADSAHTTNPRPTSFHRFQCADGEVILVPDEPRDVEVKDLPFVASRKALGLPLSNNGFPRVSWHVQSTGNYSEDCKLGESYALEFLRCNSPDALLAWIVGDMPRPLGGIEIGFLSSVASAAFSGRHAAYARVEWHRRKWVKYEAEMEALEQARKERQRAEAATYPRDASGRFLPRSDSRIAGGDHV